MTHSIQQSVMFNVLRQVSPDRLQRAVTALVENSARVTLTRTTDTEIRARVRNGEGHEYGVALTETGVFCSCCDALYRGVLSGLAPTGRRCDSNITRSSRLCCR